MRVAVVTKSLRSGGGASRFAFELADEFRNHESDVRVFTYNAPEAVAGCARIDAKTAKGRIQRHLDWRLNQLGLVGITGWDHTELSRMLGGEVDVIHVHDSYQAISPFAIARFARLAPVVHTFHDTSSFTGGCINPMGCEGYKKICGRCPERNSLGRFDLTSFNLYIRRKVYSNPRVHCAFPSRWILQEARSSLSMGSRAHYIANGFDSEDYAFRSRDEARKTLGIPEEATVVCAGAHTVSSKHKGFNYVLNALRETKVPNLIFIVLGNVSPEATASLTDIEIVAPGFVSEKERLALYYSAADLMLFPSLGDNLPTMIQESMYAQTPVLAFATGGIPELIENEVDGWLVPTGDGAGFTAALKRLLVSPERLHETGIKAREKIRRAFNMSDCYSRYKDVYRLACSSCKLLLHI